MSLVTSMCYIEVENRREKDGNAKRLTTNYVCILTQAENEINEFVQCYDPANRGKYIQIHGINPTSRCWRRGRQFLEKYPSKRAFLSIGRIESIF